MKPSATKTFAVDESVLVKHGIEIYDAKILRIDEDSDTPHYFVHYQGWSKKWDEWVSADRVLDTSDASRQMQKEAKEAAKAGKDTSKRKISTNGVVSRKKTKVANPFDDSVVSKDDARDLEEVVQEIQIQIPIPMTLKKILIDDWKNITQQEQWIDLPRTPSVKTMIADFLAATEPTDDTLRPIFDGLQLYFDKALPLLLLYRQERAQYNQLGSDIVPSSVYGAEHLLRLFVRLPLLMSQMDLDLPYADQVRIQGAMNQFLKFVQKQRQTYFVPQYIASAKFTWQQNQPDQEKHQATTAP
ncbi:unnamed protein product [Aphanomyces euteiches]|uniref:Chromo domain-containing protein n=1 Tax=Aphanomyces euteiches TaxID=100861 RepID=A0A6G0W896_9STRA|nr:hypothetical protein Ae201684_017997 [Aphanomyces euteiches]KAH9074039.1 hypothetical protein Ae201684P_015937 [Aphanomyces euteiches]